MSLCVGQAGSRVRSSRAATADRSGRGSLRTGNSSLYRSFDEQIKLPRGGLRRLAGGMTHLAEVTPHTLSAVVGCRVDGFFALLDPTDSRGSHYVPPRGEPVHCYRKKVPGSGGV